MSKKAAPPSPPRGLSFPILNLDKWIRANKASLVPPVSNRQLFADSRDAIVFVSGGPNTRNDYHVNATEELFFQLQGDIAVRVRPLDGSKPHDVIVREGEMFLLDRWVPHRPQRPPGTLGLIVEFPRGSDAQGKPHEDALRWYCPQCDELVHEARWVLRKIDEDLKVIMNDFWGGPAERRTCRKCGFVIERAGAVRLKGRKVTAVSKKLGAKKARTPKAGSSKPASARPAAKSKPAKRPSRKASAGRRA